MAGMLVKVIKIALQSVPGGSSRPGETLGVEGEARLLRSLSIGHSQRGPEVIKHSIGPGCLVVYLLWLQKSELPPVFKQWTGGYVSLRQSKAAAMQWPNFSCLSIPQRLLVDVTLILQCSDALC